ncbi:MAG: phage portal protein [Kaistia sp. SCN 65-12]|nr:MAG: phage portal protein [Kaistia sp. SCN 65-12]
MRGLFGSLARSEVKEQGSSRYGLVDEMWANFFGGYRTSKSGVAVNWRSALSVTTVLACARVRADGHATVPWKLYHKPEGSNVPVEARTHPLYDLMATAPNEWMTSLEFRETQSFHVDLGGRSYAFLNKLPNGRILEMILLDPGRVTCKQHSDYSRTYTLQGLDGTTQTVSSDRIWHVKGPSWDTVEGLDIVRLAAEAIGLALAAEESHAAFHRNGVMPSGILSVEGNVNEAGLIRLAAWVRRHFGGADNVGKLMAVDRNAKFVPVRMNGVDSQHLETRKFQVERICEVMRTMPIMIGFSGDKNATFASASEMFLAHLVHTVRPIHRRFEASADLFLLTKQERAQGYYSGFVDQEFLRANAKDRAEYNKTALGGASPGWRTPNQIRADDEEPPIPGGDYLYVPANMVAIGADGKPIFLTAPSAPPPGA